MKENEQEMNKKRMIGVSNVQEYKIAIFIILTNLLFLQELYVLY